MTDQVGAKFRQTGLTSRVAERGEAVVFEINPENFISGFASKFDGMIFCYRRLPDGDFLMTQVKGRYAPPVALFLHLQPANAPCVNQRLIAIPVKLRDGILFARY